MGRITLVNATPYNWQRTGQYSEKMKHWAFPESIPAGRSSIMSVTWCPPEPVTWIPREEPSLVLPIWPSLPRERQNGKGVVEYFLQGTSNSFEVQAVPDDGDGVYLQVHLKNISTQNNAQGSNIRLGWDEEGFFNFILSGTEGNFISSNLPVDWMQKNRGTLGNRPLRHICIPGTHDAGMSVVTDHTGWAGRKNTVTQHLSIFDQLTTGSRYFDIRPVIRGGVFKTGHFSDTGVKVAGWQGATGLSMEDVIKMINSFTSDHQELVILDLSHGYNTDVYKDFTQAEWDSLLEQLLGIQHLFVSPQAADLTLLPLDTFIGHGEAAVVVIVEPQNVVLGSYASQGFYKASQFDIYNQYSGTNDKDRMAKDQFEKMRQQRKSPDSGYFLLSWTLTQSNGQAVPGKDADSVLALAKLASPLLYLELLNSCSKDTYPNVVLVDGLNEPKRDLAALAMAVNGLTR